MVSRRRRRSPITFNDDTDTTTSSPTANDNEGTSVLTDEENDSIIHTNDEENDSIIHTNNEEKSLKSNVWHYAKKVTNDTAQYIKCKMQKKTNRGGTTTLRKHLINKHKLIHLSLPLSSPYKKASNAVEREQKVRLDYLATAAIVLGGRSVSDLRKTGITKFLSEAIPGN